MTFGKYKRLLLVISLPLLLLGLIVSEVRPYPDTAFLICQNWGEKENCRNVGGPSGNFYKYTKKQSAAWFQVSASFLENKHVYYIVEADARTVGRVTIDDTHPYADALAPALMENLKGRSAILKMGINEGQRSVDLETEIYLYCYTINFDMEPTPHIPNPGRYMAQCVANDWGGFVSIKPSPEAEQHLAVLRDSVAERADKIESEALIHRVGLTLSPLVFFLILSAVFWAIRKSIAFVRAG